MTTIDAVPDAFGRLTTDTDRHASSRTTVKRIAPDQWDRIAADFRDTTPEQTTAYACSRWGDNRVRCLAVMRNGRPIGGAVLVQFGLPLLGRGLSILKFGPLWRHRDAAQPNDVTRLDEVISALRQHVAQENKLGLVVLPLPEPEAETRLAEALTRAGFTRRGSVPDPARYLVNLGIDLEAQRKSLHGKWRYNLKKAQAHGLEIRVEPGDEGRTTFKGLYDAMLSRKQFDDRSGIGALSGMLSASEPGLRPEIVIARLNGTPTAGAVISRSGDRAMYMFGATDERALAVKAGYALHWWIVERLTGSGCLWYDLGGAEGDAGLAQFKRQFVGARGVITNSLDEYAFATDPVSRLATAGVFAWRRLKDRRLPRLDVSK